jgi:hypothetical protein
MQLKAIGIPKTEMTGDSGHFAGLFLAFFTADLTNLSFAALPRLQLRHRVWRFFSVVNPPFETGIM